MKWEENVRKVVPYVPGEQPQKKNIIKLNTNECPYPPSPMVQKAMREMDYRDLRLYPEFPEKTPLAAHLAAYYHVKEEQIFIGIGSDDRCGFLHSEGGLQGRMRRYHFPESQRADRRSDGGWGYRGHRKDSS